MKARHFKRLWDSLLPLATEDVIDELPFMCRSWQSEVLGKPMNLIAYNVPQNSLNTYTCQKLRGNLLILLRKKNEKKKTTFKAVVLCVICRQTSCQILLSPPRTMVFLDSFLFTTPPCAWNSDVLPFLGVVDYIKSSNNFKQQSLLTGLVLLERTLQQPSASL